MQRPDSKENVVQIRPGLCDCVQPIRSDRITICSMRPQTIRNVSTGIGFHKCASVKIPGPRKYTMRSPKGLFSATLDSVVLVLSTSVFHSVYTQCPQNKSMRKKVPGRDSTSTVEMTLVSLNQRSVQG